MESLNDYEVKEITRAQYKGIVEVINKNKHSTPFLVEKMDEYVKAIPVIESWEFATYLGNKKIKVMTADSVYYFKLNKIKKEIPPNEL